MMHIEYLWADSVCPYLNQATEWHLLQHARADALLIYLWQNDNAVFIGRNQNAAQECRLEQMAQAHVQLARRLTGGGAVYHDLGNLNFSFICDAQYYNVPQFMQVICKALAQFGIEAVVNGRNDLTVDGKKVSGSAFYEGDICLHHGTLLLAADLARMGRYLQVSQEKLQKNAVASVHARVGNLREFCQTLDAKQVGQAILTAAAQTYQVPCTQRVLTTEEQEKVQRLRARLADPGWLYNRHIPRDISLKGQWPWGGAEVVIAVNEGHICDAAVYTDALLPTLSAQLEQALLGSPATKEGMQQAVRHCSALTDEIKNDMLTLIETQLQL